MSIKKLLLALAFLPSLAMAWQPTKTVTVVFPNGPGAGNEISFRIVAQQVEQSTGFRWQPEHRAGADGVIAGNYFATAPTDGHTIAVPACQSAWVTPSVWYANTAKFDAMDFVPVANIARSPLAFWAHPSSRINTPQELAAAIRAKDRDLNFAIGGAGHKLAVEYLLAHLDVKDHRVQTVMYKGPAQALTDVLGAHTEFSVTPVAVGWPHVQASKLKLIGIANAEPLPGLEKAPLMNRIAPGLEIHGCWNIVLPPGTAPEIAKWYRDNFVPAIRSARSAEQFRENMMFITPREHTPEGFQASMRQMRQVWQPIAQKIKPE
jgi:tripartite-type tricarboxylate transporter receptor subunit TctC